MDQTLKGKESKLPNGLSFLDKDGHKRTHLRIKWWENPTGKTYREISVTKNDTLPNETVNESDSDSNSYYEENEKPVFFGHYWLKGNPNLYRNNICCLDYSVADEGQLVAYRHDGEKVLDESKFVFVDAKPDDNSAAG